MSAAEQLTTNEFTLNKFHQHTDVFKQHEDRQHLYDALSKLACKLSHELRNPLASLSIFGSLLTRTDKKRYGEKIGEEVKRIDQTIAELLSNTTNSKCSLNTVDLSTTCEEWLNEMLPLINIFPGRFNVSYSGDCRILGNKDLIMRMLTLCMNYFFDSCGESDRLDLSFKQKSDSVEFCWTTTEGVLNQCLEPLAGKLELLHLWAELQNGVVGVSTLSDNRDSLTLIFPVQEVQ